MSTLLIALMLASLMIRQPTDGGNYPRKDGLTTQLQTASHFHPPKEWDK